MNPLSWMTLVFLLSAGCSLADVDLNWLTQVVERIRAKYRLEGQFCLATNIPKNINPKELYQDHKDDSYIEHVNDMLNDGVYTDDNVVVARPAGPVHAEAQVLSRLGQLEKNKQNNVLLIYSYLSPCGEKCTNPDKPKYNILNPIKRKIIDQQQKKNVPHWSDVVFVFTRVFDDPKYGSTPTKEDLKESLYQLGETGLGLRNIFRCYKPENLEFQCHSCSSQGYVSNVCVDNNFVPGSSPVTDRSSSRSSSKGSSRASSSSSSSRGSSRDSSSSSSSRGSSSRGSSSSSSSRGSSSRGSSSSSSSSIISRKRGRYNSLSGSSSRNTNGQEQQ